MLSISIVTYKNSINEINSCLEPILDCDVVDTICIYDNSEVSTVYEKDVVSISEKLIYYSDTRNLGYGYGHNQAFDLCQQRQKSKYHLVMNLDVQVKSDTLTSLLGYMETSPETLHCMPKVLNSDLTIQRACKLIPTPSNLLLRRFVPNSMKSMIDQRLYELHDYDYSFVLNCPYLSGCFMFLRTDPFIEVGKFDTRYFMYPEDIDLTRRLHKLGKTECYPFVSIIHQHEQASYKSLKMTWVHMKSMAKYFNKWGWFRDSERKQFNQSVRYQINN